MFFESHVKIIPLENALIRIVVPPGATELVVTFEAAGTVGVERDNHLRAAFGEKFLLENGYGVLGFMSHSVVWYLTDDIRSFMESAELRRFLAQFKAVHTYGISMGAFGACTFAHTLGAKNVIAMAPVSTLAPDLVPWEHRFRPGFLNTNWDVAYRDAADGLKGDVESVWLLVDPKGLDAPHSERLAQAAGARTRRVDVPRCGHGVAKRLLEAGILKQVALECLRQSPATTVQQIIDSSFKKPPEPVRVVANG